MTYHPDISVVVPCYNAERVLEASIDALVHYLQGLDRNWELVLVDDGSTDRTNEIMRQAVEQFGSRRIRILHHGANHGKGWAVRNGMLAAKGQYRVFLDVDLDYRPSEIGKILASLEAGSDVTAASRVASGALLTLSPWHIQYMYTRHLMSRLLNKVFRNFFVRGITDSQAGLKGFTSEAAEAIFSRTTVKGFSFDIEVLYIAQCLGLIIREVGVNCLYGRQPSTVSFARAGIGLVRDMIKTKMNAAKGLYEEEGEPCPRCRRKLIVTADDFGLSRWANRGIIRGVESGAVSSVSVMSSTHLERWPVSMKQATGFGLHINLTEGPPASGAEGLEPIVGKDGCFLGLARLARQVCCNRVSVARLTRELLAQAEKVSRAGFRLDHIDGHEHVQHLPGVRQAVAEAARQLGICWVRVAAEPITYGFSSWACTARKLVLLPFAAATRSFFRSQGLRSSNRFFGLALVRPRDCDRALATAIRQCRGAVNEISVHLAEPGGERMDRLGAWRTRCLESLLRWNLQVAARAAKLELTSFGDVPLNGDGRELRENGRRRNG